MDRLLDAYFTNQSHFERLVHEMSHDEVAIAFVGLLRQYANDRNSSTLRERVSLIRAGYEIVDAKLGYDGKRGDVMAEAKPVNVRTGSKDKLNGNGNFSDYTFTRLEKDMAENPQMVVSGFIDGELMYIFDFPFNCIAPELKRQLEHRFPSGTRLAGEYLRSAGFSFTHYRRCTGLKRVYVGPKIAQLPQYFTRDLYAFLQT